MKGGVASREWKVGLRPIGCSCPIGSKCSELRKEHNLGSGPIICFMF